MLNDIACIVFVCVTMNHLGLISAIEGVLRRNLPIVNCPKCSTFWLVLAYALLGSQSVLLSLAISFLASYVAIWLELLEGIIDTIYNKVYETFFESDTANDTLASDSATSDTAGIVSDLQ